MSCPETIPIEADSPGLSATSGVSDAGLVERARQGDAEAFGFLVERHFEVVHLIAYSRVRDRDAAEDIAQDVFVKAFLSLEHLRDPGKFRPWLSQIARHLALNWRRDRGTERGRAISLEEIPSEHMDRDGARPGDQIAASQESVEVGRALRRLPEDLREVVVLRFVGDLSNVEIARQLDVHPATVGRHLERAMKMMKAGLEPLLRGQQAAIRPRVSALARTTAAIAAISALPPAARAAATQQAMALTERILPSAGRAAGRSGGVALLWRTLSLPRQIAVLATGAALILSAGLLSFNVVRSPAILTNSIGMRLRPIPGGSFLMGSPESEPGRRVTEGPVHRVTVRPFYMGETEVTVEQYQQFLAATGFRTPQFWEVVQRPHPKLPALYIRWEDAKAFCDWLSRVEGVTYRLPTEAEWEYACRAGSTTTFHWGDEITAAEANFDLLGGEDEQNPPVNVGSYPPNAFGLHDMAGNAREWCLDLWHDNYVGAPVDGSAWVEGAEASLPVYRGGSFWGGAEMCRSAFRNVCTHPESHFNQGFRVVRALD